MTTFEDLKPLFHQMSHSELQKTADWLVRSPPRGERGVES